MADVKSLDTSNFDAFMQREEQVKVLRFWATWCRPCIALEPIYDEVAGELGERASFAEVDIDKAPEIAGAFGIRSVPTVLVFKDGKPLDTIIGLHAKARYVDAVNNAV
ncbi:thioredoxin domain-containing protein [Methyloligella sp. 2.7D]|uniref:thioredoxin family protein n=1 Tax=unclassified Methyloligella TaxID=2625955 RepID=UPI00157CA5B9|nr:thioredoxin domain-containing protein [Methyloligella sp. GL2]QKP76624.1 thioredoxin [Methyloligella sp. GL2]